MPIYSSRKRFLEYLQEVEDRRRGNSKDDSGEKKKAARQRTFWELLYAFWKQLGEHQGKIIFSLSTLTVATLFGTASAGGNQISDRLRIDRTAATDASLVNWDYRLGLAHSVVVVDRLHGCGRHFVANGHPSLGTLVCN